jgi:hypothetical protein
VRVGDSIQVFEEPCQAQLEMSGSVQSRNVGLTAWLWFRSGVFSGVFPPEGGTPPVEPPRFGMPLGRHLICDIGGGLPG